MQTQQAQASELKPVANNLLDNFAELYQKLNKHNLDSLADVYDDHIVFEDALHRVEGIDKLTDYFAGLYENLNQCDFEIERIIEDGQQATVIWLMRYSHPKLNSGKPVEVPGVSHLKYSDKITYHRDYMDLGMMLYEQLPILGGVIRAVKRRASGS
ncbi:nuclear transport factor 2 family protein [Paraferrimonas haliotis]|uniref:Transcriptional regulator n=1 Tax=Paraferrimonas haliotis TaxID=2013866 RepID=A0AA37WWN9_9GAMM|nr:nuclear transport factor 2 family protein [Paraferrimonas haliotis]GLS83717.1 transcriptional regulator [Paraferrimonas haliotis]